MSGQNNAAREMKSKDPADTLDSFRAFQSYNRQFAPISPPSSPASTEMYGDITEVAVRALIIDDDEDVAALFTDSLTAAGYEVYSVATGMEALELLDRAVFDVLLADIYLPDMNGFDLLTTIQKSAPDVPVIMLTGYADVETARRALNMGASDFITKPCNIADLPIILERNLTRQALAQKRHLTYLRELQSSYETVLDALLSALDTRDTETEGHSERVTAYTMLLADQMDVPQEELYHIERGALLHDIGKIGVPDRILLKPSALSSEEWQEMRKHPAIGFKMCSRIAFLKGAAQIVLHHHERWDGSGYPDGLMREMIPLGARIFAVADAFDAMTTDRPYRQAMSYDDACAEIAQHSDKQFDPAVVEAFLKVPEQRWKQILQLTRRG